MRSSGIGLGCIGRRSVLFLTLDCGRRVVLDAFDYALTYAGTIAGRPNARANAKIIAHALTERDSSWGKRTTHLIPPVIDDSDPDHPKLPPVCLRAWLWCNDPIDPEYMGSDLVVVWFAEECHAEPIADVVFRAIRGLPWDELAEDFIW